MVSKRKSSNEMLDTLGVSALVNSPFTTLTILYSQLERRHPFRIRMISDLHLI